MYYLYVTFFVNNQSTLSSSPTLRKCYINPGYYYYKFLNNTVWIKVKFASNEKHIRPHIICKISGMSGGNFVAQPNPPQTTTLHQLFIRGKSIKLEKRRKRSPKFQKSGVWQKKGKACYHVFNLINFDKQQICSLLQGLNTVSNLPHIKTHCYIAITSVCL